VSATSVAEAPRASRSGWSPLRYRDFRRWWVANLVSNVGSWMQTVAAHRVARHFVAARPVR
jgi:hypothetical protein